MTSFADPVCERHPALSLRRAAGALLSRIVRGLDVSRAHAQAAADLKRRLRADTRLLRDIGISRFEAMHLTDQA